MTPETEIHLALKSHLRLYYLILLITEVGLRMGYKGMECLSIMLCIYIYFFFQRNSYTVIIYHSG
jgi:hypothetical protein